MIGALEIVTNPVQVTEIAPLRALLIVTDIGNVPTVLKICEAPLVGLLMSVSVRSRLVYTNPVVRGSVANTSSPGTPDVGAKLTAEHTGSSN